MANRIIPALPELSVVDENTLFPVDTGTQSFKVPADIAKDYFTGDVEERLDNFVDPQIEKMDAVFRAGVVSNFSKSTFDTTYPRNFKGIAYSPTLNVMVAGGFYAGTGTHADKRIMYSYDMGASWTPAPFTTLRTWSGAAWSPSLGLFILTSDTVGSTSAQIVTSPDGINWTSRTSAGTSSQRWYSAVWSPDLSLFVIVGYGGSGTSNCVQTSPDGINWTLRSTPATAGTNLNSVTWSSALGMFVAVGEGELITSTNGTTWTSRTIPAVDYQYIAWSPELAVFVASSPATAPGLASLISSTDGITWSGVSGFVGSTYTLGTITWCPEPRMFVLVDYTHATIKKLMYSKDLITWESEILHDGLWSMFFWVAKRLIGNQQNNNSPASTGLLIVGPRFTKAL